MERKKMNIGIEIPFSRYTTKTDVREALSRNKNKIKVRVKDYPKVFEYLEKRYWKKCFREEAEKYRTKAVRVCEKARQKWLDKKGEFLWSHYGEQLTRKQKVYYKGWGGRGYTEDNGKWGWKRRVWHYARIREEWEDGQRKLIFSIGDEEPEHIFTIPQGFYYDPQKQDYIKRIAPNAYYILVFQRKRAKFQLVVEYKNEEYHFGYTLEMYSDRTLRKKIQEGIAYIKERRSRRAQEILKNRLARRIQKWLASPEKLKQVWVTVQDSLNAGNCKAQTMSVYETLQARLGTSKEIGAVRADYLLTIRDDFYAKRAIERAILRKLQVVS